MWDFLIYVKNMLIYLIYKKYVCINICIYIYMCYIWYFFIFYVYVIYVLFMYDFCFLLYVLNVIFNICDICVEKNLLIIRCMCKFIGLNFIWSNE